MAEDPVGLYQGGGTLAQAVLASAPEGMLIAPVWKRVAAYMLDVVVLTLVLHFLTGQMLMVYMSDFSLLGEGPSYIAAFALNWFLFLGAHYLYFKYTGRSIGRSLAESLKKTRSGVSAP